MSDSKARHYLAMRKKELQEEITRIDHALLRKRMELTQIEEALEALDASE